MNPSPLKNANVLNGWSLRFQYGATWGPWHGNVGAESDTIELNGEKIIKIQGTGSSNHFWFNSVIATIEFHTNQGRKFGPYGKGGNVIFLQAPEFSE